MRKPRPRKDGSVDALAYVRWVQARDLTTARRTAGLSRAELAAKLRTTREAVAEVELGRVGASERYVRRLLKVCGLPEDWKPPPQRPSSAARSRCGSRVATALARPRGASPAAR